LTSIVAVEPIDDMCIKPSPQLLLLVSCEVLITAGAIRFDVAMCHSSNKIIASREVDSLNATRRSHLLKDHNKCFQRLSLRGAGRGVGLKDSIEDFDLDQSENSDSSLSNSEISDSDLDDSDLDTTIKKRKMKGKRASRIKRQTEEYYLDDPEGTKAFLENQRRMIHETYGEDAENHPEAARCLDENFTIPRYGTLAYEQYRNFSRDLLVNHSLRISIEDLGPNPHYRPSGTPVEDLPEWDGKMRYENENGDVVTLDDNLDHVNEQAPRPPPSLLTRNDSE
jgi:hypothetical protein